MGIHPNTLLILALTPDGLARKTYRDILAEVGATEEDGSAEIKIGEHEYWAQVMEGDYDEGQQIAGKAGDIVLHAHVTYGYGETITWRDLDARRSALEAWAVGICERHHCSYDIRVGANYW